MGNGFPKENKNGKEQGFTLIEAVVAAVILSLAAAALLNLLALGACLSARSEHILQAVNLAQARLEELKNVPLAEVTGQEKIPCPENAAYSYCVDIAGSVLGYGLKTVTVTLFYEEMEEEKSISLTMEKSDW